jgi:hypothetical protein
VIQFIIVIIASTSGCGPSNPIIVNNMPGIYWKQKRDTEAKTAPDGAAE